MTRKPKASPPDHAVSDEAAAYIADALMELALQFEATHFAQIRRYYQSITPPGAGPRRRDPSGKAAQSSRPQAQDLGHLIPASSLPAGGHSPARPALRAFAPTPHRPSAVRQRLARPHGQLAGSDRSGRKRTRRPPVAGRKFNPLVLSEIQNAGDKRLIHHDEHPFL